MQLNLAFLDPPDLARNPSPAAPLATAWRQLDEAWRIAALLAPSPIRDLLHRRLQPFRYLHDCSGCFRLERLPGGTCTHRKAPPCHGAHVKRPLQIATVEVAVGGRNRKADPYGSL